MLTTDPTPNSLSLLIDAIDTLEGSAAPADDQARKALIAMIDVVDTAFQTAALLASGADPRSREVRMIFLFITMKLTEVSAHLGLRPSSRAAKCLSLAKGGR
ncbi:hypothetical protein [Breoghania sp.]|uniref:hypothetical protein n=1 Tax=Breoghania sp. TaxID=2065378 RepID=UPI002AA69935|nr:hypothetical protein [Breoghania sp.]